MEELQTKKPEKKLWFRAKTYGYGWYPASWQGWAAIIIYLMAVVFAAWDILRGAESGVLAVKRFIVIVFILSFFLLFICYKHGEKLGWRWGKEGEKKTDHDDHRSI